MSRLNSKTCILLLSCDKFSPIWDGITRNWQERILRFVDLDAFLLTNHKEYKHNGFVELKIGDDIAWSSNLSKALARLRDLGYEYVFTGFDDMFILDDIDSTDLEGHIKYAQENDLLELKLARKKSIKKWFNTRDYSTLKRGKQYSATCVFTLWNIIGLNNLLIASESAWEFERNATNRVSQSHKMMETKKGVFRFYNSLIKGKLQISAPYFQNRYGFKVTGDFPSMSKFEFIKRRFKRLLHTLKMELYAS